MKGIPGFTTASLVLAACGSDGNSATEAARRRSCQRSPIGHQCRTTPHARCSFETMACSDSPPIVAERAEYQGSIMERWDHFGRTDQGIDADGAEGLLPSGSRWSLDSEAPIDDRGGADEERAMETVSIVGLPTASPARSPLSPAVRDRGQRLSTATAQTWHFVVLTPQKVAYTAQDGWIETALGQAVPVVRRAEWGALTERRVQLPSGFEVEFGFVEPSWARTDPIDPGTAMVVVDGGLQPVYDPEAVLVRLAAAVN